MQRKIDEKQKQLWQDHYPKKKMVFEVVYLAFTLLIWGRLLVKTLQQYSNPFSVVMGFVIAQFVVDFVSGLLHWACDTWGQFSTPILGPTLIRSFRMHHVDPLDITRHGFIETNASSTYPMPPFILFMTWLVSSSFIYQCCCWTIIFGVILGIFTNEIHKWAHMNQAQQNPIISLLQRSRLILSHEHHHRHHIDKFDRSYCIINGWMNPILQKLDFWRRTENLISWATGAKPRADDAFWRQLK